jgi:hypothetical protein
MMKNYRIIQWNTVFFNRPIINYIVEEERKGLFVKKKWVELLRTDNEKDAKDFYEKLRSNWFGKEVIAVSQS